MPFYKFWNVIKTDNAHFYHYREVANKMFTKKYFEDCHTLHVNTMPNRCYYIPVSKEMYEKESACELVNEMIYHREKSDRMQLLNGNWKFKYYESFYDLPEDIEEVLQAEDETAFCDEIPVPGNWQNYGYDSHQYINYRYPFPVDPPYVPVDNPCGLYVHKFEYEKDQKAPETYLLFEGVDSCFYVWMNGHFVGYSQVSHSTSEFHISEYINEGANVLCVLVLKWCDGSYLECQDKFRMTGIFRDVYLLKRPSAAIRSYRISTNLNFKEKDDAISRPAEDEACEVKSAESEACEVKSDEKEACEIRSVDREVSEIKSAEKEATGINAAEITLEYEFLKEASDVKVTLYNENCSKILGRKTITKDAFLAVNNENEESKTSLMGSISFMIGSEDLLLWSPETPYLYPMIIEAGEEVFTERVGLRKIEARGRVVYANNHPVKFRGVNRHDSDPVTGSVISIEQMERDLTLMKMNNINAIRTSHYPNSPIFPQLCDAYGFYLIDEADNESHGTFPRYYEDFDNEPHRLKHWNEVLSNNPDFIEATVDRVQRLVIRDQNRPCVVIWSMGNECGYGCTIEEALAWTKSYDNSRLTHYESAFHKGVGTYDYSNLDLYSRMYPSTQELKRYLEEDHKKPYIMCEYCHSMGNGPGDLEDYQQIIENYDGLCGGFVWEWCEHAIDRGLSENGKKMYAYGGDSGEDLDDSNFCMDGLVFPDRRPNSGLLEYRNVIRPVRAISFDVLKGDLILKNCLNELDLKDNISIRVELERDGILLYSKDITKLPSIPARTRGSINIDLADIAYRLWLEDTENSDTEEDIDSNFGSEAETAEKNGGFSLETETGKKNDCFTSDTEVTEEIDCFSSEDEVAEEKGGYSSASEESTDVEYIGAYYLKLHYLSLREYPGVHVGDELGVEQLRICPENCVNRYLKEILDSWESGATKETTESVKNQEEREVVSESVKKQEEREVVSESVKKQEEREVVSESDKKQAETERVISTDWNISENSRLLTVECAGVSYTYDKLHGTFPSIRVDGEELLTQAARLSIWRAPTDNDMNIKTIWMNAGFDRSFTHCYNTTYVQKDFVLEIRSKMSILANALQKSMDIFATYEINRQGQLKVRYEVQVADEFPMLPRFGLRICLKDDFSDMLYSGYGPMDSYADKKQASTYGLYSCKVADNHEDYVRPQENGSHFGCDYAKVSSEKIQITFASKKPFSFQASPYTEEELTRTAHNYELPESDQTVVHLDYKQNGIGSNSCGPELLEQYRFDEKTFTFECYIMFERLDG